MKFQNDGEITGAESMTRREWRRTLNKLWKDAERLRLVCESLPGGSAERYDAAQLYIAAREAANEFEETGNVGQEYIS